MGRGFCHWNRGLCMALVACLVLCLGPEAEAIRCKQCRAKNIEKCRYRKKACENTHENGVCMVGKKYTDDRLTEVFMKCSVDSLTCGAEVEIPMERFRMNVECCSENDFCSNDMLSD